MSDNTGYQAGILLPDWMDYKTKSEGIIGSKKGTGFIQKTISSISKIVLYDLMGERYAVKNGLLQGIDPRVKLVSVMFFMLYAGVTGSFITLSLLAAIAVMMVYMSKLGFIVYLKRVWMFIPLIMMILSVPAATNLFVEGDAAIYIYKDINAHIGSIRLPQEMYFSIQGISAVLKTVFRVGVSISFGYILVMTTRWSHITKALAALGVPRIIVAILNMTYRYIFVLSSIAVQMLEARQLRTVGSIKGRDNRDFIANSIGFLFIKANKLSEEIYDSMICRGYNGDMVSLKEFKLTVNDYIWIANNIIIAIILIII